MLLTCAIHVADMLEPFIFPEGDPGAVTIMKRDLDCLLPHAWLNDTIIEFYLK